MSYYFFFIGLGLSYVIIIPLGLKWELDKKVLIISSFIIGLISWIAAEWIIGLLALKIYQIITVQILIIIGISASLLLWRFFRDPDRVPPEDKNIILSPADGRIIYIKSIKNGEFAISEKNGKEFPLNDFIHFDLLKSTGFLIGIAMNYLDVHINRAPIAGKVIKIQCIKGLFISLKKGEAVLQNERSLTVIDNGIFSIGVVQIASRLVRKIVTFLEEGHCVAFGQRIGAIRLGSQVDLIIPDMQGLKIAVNSGDKVKAGISIIASFSD